MIIHSLLCWHKWMHNTFTINERGLVHQGQIQSPISHINHRLTVCLMFNWYTDGFPGVFHVICFLLIDDGWVRGLFAAWWPGQCEEAVWEPGAFLLDLSVQRHAVSFRAEICPGENVIMVPIICCSEHEVIYILYFLYFHVCDNS